MSATDSWVAQSQSQNLKFEHSPAESFLSAPGDMYPSLFGASSPATTMNPLDIMTPKSVADEPRTTEMAPLSGLATPAPEAAATPACGEKKSKKRKSWGQVLPEPKTNLPPRKRAKTEDEKEQRRVERVLRNRRAAQSSRERKRLEVEALELRNKDLESLLRQVQQTNLALIEELRKVQRGSGVVSRTSPSFGGPVTLSQELFSSQDGHSAIELGSRSIEELLMSTSSHTTVNPASLSPSLHPVDGSDDMSDDDDEDEDDEQEPPQEKAAPAATTEESVATAPARTSPDTTQHPAVSVGGGPALGDVAPLLPTAPDAGAAPAAPATPGVHLGHDGFGLSAALDADRYVLESGLLASPGSLDLDYDHLAGHDDPAAFPFPPTNDLFDINDYLDDGELLITSSTDSSLLLDPETEVSSEDPIQQPHSGASSLGCDDGGIAVGVI